MISLQDIPDDVRVAITKKLRDLEAKVSRETVGRHVEGAPAHLWWGQQRLIMPQQQNRAPRSKLQTLLNELTEI